MTITLCYYGNQGNQMLNKAVTLGTRLVTRRPGQPLGDVPAHVATIIDDGEEAWLYEAILSGIHKRRALPADYAWSRVVPVPDPDGSRQSAEALVGHKYRTLSIALVIARLLLGRFLDPSIGFVDNCADSKICSTYAEQIVEDGGFPLHMLLAATGNDFTTPTRPNDLWWATRQLWTSLFSPPPQFSPPTQSQKGSL